MLVPVQGFPVLLGYFSGVRKIILSVILKVVAIPIMKVGLEISGLQISRVLPQPGALTWCGYQN
jgi:hypothetical protein